MVFSGGLWWDFGSSWACLSFGTCIRGEDYKAHVTAELGVFLVPWLVAYVASG